MLRKEIKKVVDDNTTKRGKSFEYFIQLLILLSLLVFAVETLPGLSTSEHLLLHNIELFLISIFSIEYLLRLYVSENPIKYIFSFYGIIDLMTILPFYLHLGLGFSSLRALRIFRIFRALKIVRYNKALKRFKVAAGLIKEEIILFSILTCVMLYIVAAGIYFFEHDAQPELFKSIFHSLWWSVVTLSTVGYGDVFPITLGGKVFTFFVLLIGVGLLTIPAGIFASALMEARELEEEELKNKN